VLPVTRITHLKKTLSIQETNIQFAFGVDTLLSGRFFQVSQAPCEVWIILIETNQSSNFSIILCY
jgi:hypothetical protein